MHICLYIYLLRYIIYKIHKHTRTHTYKKSKLFLPHTFNFKTLKADEGRSLSQICACFKGEPRQTEMATQRNNISKYQKRHIDTDIQLMIDDDR